MKVINSLKNWWYAFTKSERIALIITWIAVFAGWIFALFVPMVVLKLDYNATNILLGIIMVIFGAAMLFGGLVPFANFIEKHFKKVFKKIVILLASAVALIFIAKPIGGMMLDYLFPKKADFDALVEVAEIIQDTDDLYRYADSFSWSSDSKHHNASFGFDNISIDVTYNEDFEITKIQNTDGIAASIFLFYAATALGLGLIIISSHIVFFLKKSIVFLCRLDDEFEDD